MINKNLIRKVQSRNNKGSKRRWDIPKWAQDFRSLYQNKKYPFFVSHRGLVYLKKLHLMCMDIQDIDNYDVQGLVSYYVNMMLNYEKHKGRIWSIRHMKELYTVCERFSVSCCFEPIPYSKADKNGFPIKLKPFLPLLTSQKLIHRRLALYLMQLYKLQKTHATDYDLSSIVDTTRCSGIIPNGRPGNMFRLLNSTDKSILSKAEYQLILNGWRWALEDMFPKDKLRQRIAEIRSLSSVVISTKMGPNGPSLDSTLKDWIAIGRNERLKNSIINYATGTNNQELLESVKFFEEDDEYLIEYDVHTSRLSVKQEKGGKVRVFALIDWFSQSALLSTHTFYFKILEGLKEDGTFDQDQSFETVKQWTSMGLPTVSIDLSKATDVLPVGILYEIHSKAFGKYLAGEWLTILTERDFLTPDNKLVRYSTGQPMGAYSSWAILAIWHHLTFKAAKHAAINSGELIDFPATGEQVHTVTGDDSCTRSQNVAKFYKLILKLLDMKISTTKGYGPESFRPNLNPIEGFNSSVAEYVKRVVWSGHEVTPISPALMLEASEYPDGLNSLLFELHRRDYPSNRDYPRVVSLANKSFKPLLALQNASFPLWCAPLMKGGNTTNYEVELYQSSDDYIWNKVPYEVILRETRLVISDMQADAVSESYSVQVRNIMKLSAESMSSDPEKRSLGRMKVLERAVYAPPDLSKSASARVLFGEAGSLIKGTREIISRSTLSLITSSSDLTEFIEKRRRPPILRKQLSRILANVTRRVKHIVSGIKQL